MLGKSLYLGLYLESHSSDIHINILTNVINKDCRQPSYYSGQAMPLNKFDHNTRGENDFRVYW